MQLNPSFGDYPMQEGQHVFYYGVTEVVIEMLIGNTIQVARAIDTGIEYHGYNISVFTEQPRGSFTQPKIEMVPVEKPTNVPASEDSSQPKGRYGKWVVKKDVEKLVPRTWLEHFSGQHRRIITDAQVAQDPEGYENFCTENGYSKVKLIQTRKRKANATLQRSPSAEIIFAAPDSQTLAALENHFTLYTLENGMRKINDINLSWTLDTYGHPPDNSIGDNNEQHETPSLHQ